LKHLLGGQRHRSNHGRLKREKNDIELLKHNKMPKNKESKIKSLSITKTTTQTEQNTQACHKAEFKWPANKEQD